MNNDQNNNTNPGDDVQDVDLQKSLDENLEAMNTLLKAKNKKEYSEEEIKEMMKNKKAKEYMKKELKNEDDNEDEDDDVNKSFSDDGAEVFEADEFLKSIEKKLNSLIKSVKEISETVEDLQKSFNENQDLQKSFGGVLSSQSELIKSINEEVEKIGSAPTPVKGVVNKSDLFKSALGDNFEEESKLLKSSVGKVKQVLLKSFQDGEINGTSISRWEQSGYDLSVFSKEEIEKIESKL